MANSVYGLFGNMFLLECKFMHFAQLNAIISGRRPSHEQNGSVKRMDWHLQGYSPLFSLSTNCGRHDKGSRSGQQSNSRRQFHLNKNINTHKMYTRVKFICVAHKFWHIIDTNKCNNNSKHRQQYNTQIQQGGVEYIHKFIEPRPFFTVNTLQGCLIEVVDKVSKGIKAIERIKTGDFYICSLPRNFKLFALLFFSEVLSFFLFQSICFFYFTE